MRDQEKMREIARVIVETLTEDFVNIKILDVRVSDETEFTDDDFLSVEVLFEGDPKEKHVFSRAVRHVRPKLEEIGESAFPIFSFTSQDELGGKRFEPA